ncbi:hypothetical protein D3C77_628710 [compost metagenome]
MMDIKQKCSSRLEPAIRSLERTNDIFFLQQVIETVTERNDGIYRFRHLPVSHILLYPTDASFAKQPYPLRSTLHFTPRDGKHIGR